MKKVYQLALGGLCVASSMGAKEQQKANVLFIIADDLRPELNCYGEKHMITPNFDAIAKDGTLFSHSYCQQAVSAATRASFLTGVRPDITGVDYPYSVYFVNEFLPTHSSVQKYLYDNGYYVRTLGKVHHGVPENFSEEHYSPKDNGSPYFLKPENAALPRKQAPQIESLDVPDNAYRDGKIADEALATIKRIKAQDKPFFLTVGFQKPHLPFCAPKKYFDLYDLKSLPKSPNPQPTIGANIYSKKAGDYLQIAPGEGEYVDGVVVTERAQVLRQAYFACVSYVDAQIGKILDELKKDGLYENTLIVVIGDHGWHLGDNAHWGKSTNFERSTKSPLIVKPANKDRLKNYVCDNFVEYVDIYPSIVDAANLTTPEHLEGLSFLPLTQKKNLKWKSAAFSQFHRGKDVEGYSIRTKEYRYTEWINNKTREVLETELYDHKKDPLETINIASKNPAISKQLSQQLNAGWKAALPKGVVNNSNNPIAPPFVAWGPEANKAQKRKQQEKQAKQQQQQEKQTKQQQQQEKPSKQQQKDEKQEKKLLKQQKQQKKQQKLLKQQQQQNKGNKQLKKLQANDFEAFAPLMREAWFN